MAADVAPAELERVRALLNTWSIPNGRDQEPVDQLADLVVDHAAWSLRVGTAHRPSPSDLPTLRQLRGDLRAVLGRWHAPELDPWVVRLGVRPTLTPEGASWPLVLTASQASCSSELFCCALDALNRHLWHRLRACPGCQYVFFDSSRNGSRNWCRMTRDDPSGRSCGSLAKARAKRARDRATG
jgi:CGNR zinc finger